MGSVPPVIRWGGPPDIGSVLPNVVLNGLMVAGHGAVRSLASAQVRVHRIPMLPISAVGTVSGHGVIRSSVASDLDAPCTARLPTALGRVLAVPPPAGGPSSPRTDLLQVDTLAKCSRADGRWGRP
jgi:hypothetical protein